jgi:poly(3-hydroxybutyrate) depolymerase
MSINDCSEPESVEPSASYVIERATCSDDAAVEYVLLDEGGHDWVHSADPVFDWFTYTWKFFQDHPID